MGHRFIRWPFFVLQKPSKICVIMRLGYNQSIREFYCFIYSMDWSKISYDEKLIAIKDILEEIAYDDITFAWFKAIITVEPKPSEKYLDSCYDVISNMIKISTIEHNQASQKLHDRLVEREKWLHNKEAQEKQVDNTDDILQTL